MTLTADQTAGFRAQLTSERARLADQVATLAESTDGGNTVSNQSEENGLETHLGDLGTTTFLRERDLAVQDQEERTIEEIDAALARIEDGTYGTCEACGEPIPTERLEALPWARFDVAHQPDA